MSDRPILKLKTARRPKPVEEPKKEVPSSPAAEGDRPMTQADLEQLDAFADKIFGKVGIDVNFTRHFLDRVNDPRNKKQITLSELTRLFKQEYKRWAKPIAQLGDDAQAIMKDLKTDINIPFVLNWDERTQEFDLYAKTVMRKKGFKSNNNEPEFPVESYQAQMAKLQLSEDATCDELKHGCVFRVIGQEFPVYIVKDVNGAVCDTTVHLSDTNSRDKQVLCKKLQDTSTFEYVGSVDDTELAEDFDTAYDQAQQDYNDDMYHRRSSGRSKRLYPGAQGVAIKLTKRLGKIANEINTNEYIKSADRNMLMQIRGGLAKVIVALNKAFTENDSAKMKAVEESVMRIETSLTSLNEAGCSSKKKK